MLVILESLIRRISDHDVYHFICMICCVYCIFVWDIRSMVNTLITGLIFDALSIFCLAFFSVDVLVSLWKLPHFSFPPRVVFDILTTAAFVFCIPLLTSDVVADILRGSESTPRVLIVIRNFQVIRYWKILTVYQSTMLSPPQTISENMSRTLMQELVVFVLLCFMVVPRFAWPYIEESAWYSFSRSLSIGLLLGISRIYLFAPSNSFTQVLYPLATVMDKVERIRKDPMGPTEDRERRTRDMVRITQLARLDTAKRWWTRYRLRRELAAEWTNVEPLEKTIEQIGQLLAVGFGAAGARIVAENMKNIDNMEIHAMVPGRRIEAIFGHFAIQNFSLLTSILQDKVLLFVNQVCDIVHGIVDEFHGIPNRSSGDSFLLVWTVHADLAVAACIKIQIAINRSIELWEYGKLPALIGYRVRVHMGLHRGWAIEGAIGSNLKIDPTYLSPDVNRAQNLQEANKEYGTTVLLVSNEFMKSCSFKIRNMFRQIDHQIFSMDLDVVTLLTPYETEHASGSHNEESKVESYRIRLDRERRKATKWTLDVAEMLRKDKYFRQMREGGENVLFRSLFKKGFLNYECGEWAIAKDAFQQASVIRPSDGPCKHLLTICEKKI